jgi:hypothetical protein
MVKCNFLPVAVATSLFTGLINQACAAELSCPSSISVNESLATALPDGWSSHVDTSPRYLQGVTFFDDNPEKNASLAPTSDKASSGNERIAQWRFGSSGVPVWLGCRYEGTHVMLTRQLPISYKECRLVYGPGGIVRKLSCD